MKRATYLREIDTLTAERDLVRQAIKTMGNLMLTSTEAKLALESLKVADEKLTKHIARYKRMVDAAVPEGK